MKSTTEGGSNLLDSTVVLYGTSNSNTHNNNNCPMLTAGGKDLGIKHGQHLKLKSDVPMSNLLLTLLHSIDVPVETFADSTGELDGLADAEFSGVRV